MKLIRLLKRITTASLSSAMLEQAPRRTHDTARHVTTRRACRVVTCRLTWRNKWNLGLLYRPSDRTAVPMQSTY